MSPDRIRPGSAGRPEDREQRAPEDELTEDHAFQDLEALAAGAHEGPETADEDASSLEDSSAPTGTPTPTGAAPDAPARAETGRVATKQRNARPAAREEVVETPVQVAPHKPGRWRRIYYGETNLDFVGRRRTWFAFSAILVIAGAISLGTRGLDLGIEFVGGTSWTVQSKTLTVTAAQSAAASAGLSGADVTVLGNNGTHSRTVEVEAKLAKGESSGTTQAKADAIANALARAAHTTNEKVSIQTVGPSWGGQITHKAVVALIVFFILIAIYISIFFEWRMALAAIIAVLHDIMVTVGIYSLTGLLVTPDTVVAFLTILGYSLYDTIVVFDRVRDNLRHLSVRDRVTVSDIVNLSMNQTLARSINTSLVAIMPILAVLILGAEVLGATTLQYFGLALLVGLTTGAYSSLFIASPLVAMLKEREQRFRIIRERIAQRGGERLVLTPAAVAAGVFGDNDGASRSPRATERARRNLAAANASVSRADETVSGDDTDGLARSSSGPRPTPRPRQPQARRPASRSRRRGGRR
jgi:preprotein translocase subunit SecF